MCVYVQAAMQARGSVASESVVTKLSDLNHVILPLHFRAGRLLFPAYLCFNGGANMWLRRQVPVLASALFVKLWSVVPWMAVLDTDSALDARSTHHRDPCEGTNPARLTVAWLHGTVACLVDALRHRRG